MKMRAINVKTAAAAAKAAALALLGTEAPRRLAETWKNPLLQVRLMNWLEEDKPAASEGELKPPA